MKTIKILLLFNVAISFTAFSQVKKVAISVDDLPFVLGISTELEYKATQNILDVFNQNKIPAIGFVNEGKIFNNPEKEEARKRTLSLWESKGYYLGNHTYSHGSLNNVSVEDYQQDILKGEIYLREIWKDEEKKYPKYYRYPYLQTGPTEEKKKSIEKFLIANEYINVPVTIDNSEWIFNALYVGAMKKEDEEQKHLIGNLYVQHMKEYIDHYESLHHQLNPDTISQILLIHANHINADYLEVIIDYFDEKDYEFVSVEEAMSNSIYNSTNNYVGPAGISWLERWAISAGKEFKQAPEIDRRIMEWFENR